MSTTAIVLLCLHCFCVGGIIFSITTDNRDGAGLAFVCWLIVILINATRFVVLL
jgi:hypothetical protein